MGHPTSGSRYLHASLFVGCLLLGSCSKGSDSNTAADQAGSTPAASVKRGDEQLAQLSEYRLTMEKFDKYAAAQRNMILRADKLPPAEKAAMDARSESRAKPDATLDDMVQHVEAEPLMKDAVRDAGLSPREFAMIALSYMQTAMAAGVAKMRPNDNNDSLIRAMKANPANVKFLLDNEAELTRKQKALTDEIKRMEGADDRS